ncbi:MAG: hypothetical protein EBS05_24425 [Proteobacteria bacterium]|nr:hypothetical protein [Pseudomonadota bacterium]
MNGELAAGYKSASQCARVVTEYWAEHNLYCPNCTCPSLSRLNHNAKANDFSCPQCKYWYQLKGQQTPIRNSVPDGAYETMMNVILSGETPNFYLMHYHPVTWSIKNLMLIPHFAFPLSAIIKRKPLAATARRAGWIGCNIDLTRIPVEARIHVVTEQNVLPEAEVRSQFRRVKPLGEIGATEEVGHSMC